MWSWWFLYKFAFFFIPEVLHLSGVPKVGITFFWVEFPFKCTQLLSWETQQVPGRRVELTTDETSAWKYDAPNHHTTRHYNDWKKKWKFSKCFWICLSRFIVIFVYLQWKTFLNDFPKLDREFLNKRILSKLFYFRNSYDL